MYIYIYTHICFWVCREMESRAMESRANEATRRDRSAAVDMCLLCFICWFGCVLILYVVDCVSFVEYVAHCWLSGC